MSVNVENMRKWVAALRSGKYKQGKNRLKHAGRHCCLGVACDVSDVDMKGCWGEGTLNYDVSFWLGLRSEIDLGLHSDIDADWSNPRLTHPEMGQGRATEANDELGWSFSDIADAIEHTWPEVKEQV